MAIIPDLKHVLNNVCGEPPIEFKDTPVIVICQNRECSLVKVEKRGPIWKVLDTFNNEWTISTLPRLLQGQLKNAISSKYDSRVKFYQTWTEHI